MASDANDRVNDSSASTEQATTPPATSTEIKREQQQQQQQQQQLNDDVEKGEKEEKDDGPKAPVGLKPSGQPNGGTLSWLQVAACFSIFFNTWGMLNTFGIYQTYYESGTLFQESSSNIAWIGSIQGYCVLVLGMVSGVIYDKGYLRLLLLTGSFLVVFGFMMLSICKTFWQALLAQGFCVGIGAGVLFTPSLALLPTYFSTKLGLAIGLAASGSSLGGVIYPIVFYRLINKIGFGWTNRVIGFIALGTLLVPVVFAKMRIKPAKSRAIFDIKAFNDGPYLFFTLSAMIGLIGLYVVLFYISYFGLATKIASSDMAFYLIPILNAASVFGRTIPNYISDKTGPLNLFGLASIICCALTFAMIGVKSLGALIAIAVLYGFFSGVFIALPGVCFVQLTADKSKIGTRIGMGFGFMAFSVLIGGPGGGKILGGSSMDLHWRDLWIFGGVMSLASGVMLIALRFYLTKGKLFVKV